MALRHLIVPVLFFAATTHAEPLWFRVLVDDAKVGHALMQREQSPDGHLVDTTRIEIELQGAGRPNRIAFEHRFESAADGAPLAWFTQLQTHDVLHQQTATIEDGTIAWRNNDQGIEREWRAPLPAGVTWPLTETARLREAVSQLGRVLTFQGLDTQTGKAVDVELRIGERERIALGDRDVDAVAVTRTTRKSDSTTTSTTWLDAGLRPVRVAMMLAGTRLSLVAATREAAQAPNTSLDFLKRQFVRSPYRIPAAATSQRIRYVLVHPDSAWTPPSTGEQRARPGNNGAWTLDVCAACGDEMAPATPPADALAPNERIESEAPDIVDGARTAAGIADPRRRMLALVRYVRSRVTGTNGYLGYGTALQAARTGQGDCAAYALYLAALGRAAGIPTRVAAGMVYNAHYAGRTDVFVPHVWTQALIDGRWTSFDAAMDGFDSGHVALVVGQGEPQRFAAAMSAMAALQVRSIAQVAQRAAAGAGAR